jgi:hypothetical protein
MDIFTAVEVVATMLAGSAARQVTDDVGKSLGAEIMKKLSSIFHGDVRAQVALEEVTAEVTAEGSQHAINELADALKYYANRDEVLKSQIIHWATGDMSTVKQKVSGRDGVYVAGGNINVSGKSPGEILDERFSRASCDLAASDERTRLEAILRLERIAKDAVNSSDFFVSAQEHYSKPQVIEKKKSPRVASNESR